MTGPETRWIIRVDPSAGVWSADRPGGAQRLTVLRDGRLLPALKLSYTNSIHVHPRVWVDGNPVTGFCQLIYGDVLILDRQLTEEDYEKGAEYDRGVAGGVYPPV